MSLGSSDTSLIVRATHQVCQEMPGEVIILSLESGISYSLDAVGAKIWALIEKPISVSGICDSICNEYDVPEQDCERDVQSFIEGLKAVGLIQVHAKSSSDSCAPSYSEADSNHDR